MNDKVKLYLHAGNVAELRHLKWCVDLKHACYIEHITVNDFPSYFKCTCCIHFIV